MKDHIFKNNKYFFHFNHANPLAMLQYNYSCAGCFCCAFALRWPL
jgi:hypothetical protein